MPEMKTHAFRSRRAFLVWLNDEAQPSKGHLCGRVEHVDSGTRARFASQQELIEFLTRMLDERSPTDSTEE